MESKISGDAPRLNSITVPTEIVEVIGLLKETVVKPPATLTPLTVVSAAIPPTEATMSWPLRTSDSPWNIKELAPTDACAYNLAKYLVSAPFSDWTTLAYLESPLKKVKEFAASEPNNVVEITPGPVRDETPTESLLNDTQLLAVNADVLITLVILTVFALGEVLSSNVSVSSILILLTILPYNLLSINAVAVACVPAPGGAAMLIVGCVVNP